MPDMTREEESLIREGTASPELRLRAARHGSFQIQNTVACYPDLSEEEQLALLESSVAGTRLGILQNSKSIGAAVRHQLLSGLVRINPLATSARFAALESFFIRFGSDVTLDEVKEAFELVPSLSQSELAYLLVGSDFITLPPGAPEFILTIAEGNPFLTGVMFELHMHPGIPQDVLEKALRDTSSPVIGAATQNPAACVDDSYPLLTLTMAANSIAKPEDRAEDFVLSEGQEVTLATFEMLNRRVRPDFLKMFGLGWKGTVREFIEYADALDT